MNKFDNNSIDSEIFIRLGKIMYENITYKYDTTINTIVHKTKNDYINNYIKKLNMQIESIEKEISNLDDEIYILEKKHIELFTKIIINKDFTKKRYIFNFKNNYNNDLLEYEKYKLNQITIDKLKNDKNILIKILDNTNKYKENCLNKII
jgi:hypothetical protein